jgi:hypothetical protein
MNDGRPAVLFDVVEGKPGIVAPGLIDEIEGAVRPVASDQSRDGVDRQLQLAPGFGQPSLAPAQRNFGFLLVVHVETHAVPSDHVSAVVA